MSTKTKITLTLVVESPARRSMMRDENFEVVFAAVLLVVILAWGAIFTHYQTVCPENTIQQRGSK